MLVKLGNMDIFHMCPVALELGAGIMVYVEHVNSPEG